MSDLQIDADAFVAALDPADRAQMLIDMIGDVSRLTAAIRAKHPMIMGKGDGAIDTAIHLIASCRCR